MDLSASARARLLADSPDRSRRRVLATLTGTLACGPLLLPGCTSAPAHRSGPDRSSSVAPGGSPAAARFDPADYRAVNRLTWGANRSTMQRMQAIGYPAWLAQQLAPEPAVLPADIQRQIDSLQISRLPLAERLAQWRGLREQADAAGSDADKQAAHEAAQQAQQRAAQEAMTRFILRSLYSTSQVQEHLTWFWFNHFNVFMHKGELRLMVGDYEDQAIRPHALGRFRDLLFATVTHPAMLVYLDNAQNAAGHVNENYARELLELHTLGVDAGYTQRDVQEMARVLTGLGVQPVGGVRSGMGGGGRPPLAEQGPRAALLRRFGLAEFRPQRHDFGDKTVLGHRVEGTGFAEIEDMVDRLARHPACARFVCRKLARFFVSDEPAAALVDRLVQTWSHSDGHIGSVMRTLALSPELRGQAAPGPDAGRFKDPVHYVLSAVRLAYDDKPILNAGPIISWLNRLGEGLYNHSTPDGYPLTEAAWSGSGQMAARFEVARAIGSGSAGLFRAEGSTGASAASQPGSPPLERPAFPQLSNALYFQAIEPMLAADTRRALDQARSPQEWNAYLLSSPEFMVR